MVYSNQWFGITITIWFIQLRMQMWWILSGKQAIALNHERDLKLLQLINKKNCLILTLVTANQNGIFWYVYLMVNLYGLEFIDRAFVYSCIWLTKCWVCFIRVCLCVHENGMVVNGEIIIPL